MNQYNLTMSAVDAASSVGILDAVRQAQSTRVDQSPLAAASIESAVSIAEARLSGPNKHFAPLYAGALVAKHARGPQDVALATSLLRRDPLKAHHFAARLAQFLHARGALEPKVVVFGNSAPFDGWKKTSVYSAYMNGDVAQVLEFARKYPPIDGVPTILDIGTGTGVLISMIVNKLAEELGLKKVRIILNDQSPGMLKSAQAYCQANIRIPCDLVFSECRIEDISESDVATLAAHQPIWFMHGSASIHHMPRDRKIDAFRRLTALSNHLLLAEFNGNHDLPEANSPELFYSVAGFYGYLFGDILASPATPTEKNATIDEFLLAEAMIILRSERRFGPASELGRVDYHTIPEEWMALAREAGYSSECFVPLVRIEGGRPVTYFIHFKRK